MNYFATVKFNGPMTDNLNFMNVANAAISLFVMHSGNNFYELSIAVSTPRSVNFDCIDDPTYEDYVNAGKAVGCGHQTASIIIFYTFWIMVTLIFINLFIAIILQGYSSSVTMNNKWFNLKLPTKFKTAWSYIDKDATGYIKES